jgi:hypothetical protein
MSDLSDIREHLSYDPATGDFTWLKAPKHGRFCKAGDLAGGLISQGYIHLMFRGRAYKAHRLAWFFTYGVLPSHQIDHINGVRSDNRIANLRAATNSQNQANSRLSPRNKTGVKGVYRDRATGKFVAGIRVDGRRVHLGRFETLDAAAAAYAAAAVAHFRKYARISDLNSAGTEGVRDDTNSRRGSD